MAAGPRVGTQVRAACGCLGPAIVAAWSSSYHKGSSWFVTKS